MSTVVMNKKDEVIMKLVHYFITEENYNPIVVNGVKDEIWLENSDGPYRIIRINSNNIFNKEQLRYDFFKIESIVKQIKKKTFSFSVNTLNILLDVNEDLTIEGTKTITPVSLPNDDLNITDTEILEAFPDINEKLLKDTSGVELIINVTKDINAKTERDNKVYEKTFKPKPIILTYLIILACIITFFIDFILTGPDLISGEGVSKLGYILGDHGLSLIHAGEWYRLITHIFLHGSLVHLLCNMYSLYILGGQIETFLGRIKFLFVFIISGLSGGLLSAAINLMQGNNILAVGASGAIFGLMGALLYFGYHYRTYLGEALRRQIIPVIILNLALGFMITGIDNYAHIGGLVAGIFATMSVGVESKSKLSERVSGIICLSVFIGVAIFLLLK